MKFRKRLKKDEAEKLGFKAGKKKPDGNPHYNLTADQLVQLQNYRTDKVMIITGKSTLKDAQGNLVMEWTKTSLDKQKQIDAMREAAKGLLDKIQPTPLIPRPTFKKEKNLCNQYTLTDFHLGLMAWGEETGDDYDMKIAEKLLVDWFKRAIEISPKAKKAIFAQIGDFLHWDGMDAVTPMSSHLLDADTRFTKLVRVAIRAIRQIIQMLLEKYDEVHVIMAEGNHDMASSIWLRETFNMYYENEPRITIDTRPDPYYCFVWGKTCLFYHHGHKKNVANVDTVFVAKFKEQYGKSKHVFSHIGHLHHVKMIESNLMVAEQHRTLAAKDAYASRGGWLSGRDAKVITYHTEFGEVGRLTISPEMLK